MLLIFDGSLVIKDTQIRYKGLLFAISIPDSRTFTIVSRLVASSSAPR